MPQLTTIRQNGVGRSSHEKEIYDSTGTGMLPLQAKIVSGTPTFKVNGRLSADFDWVEIVPAGNAAFLQSIAWVPFIELQITNGPGEVLLGVGEK